ncbi:MAG: exodeoxyribonuclease V subunit gamma [Propionibacteriaceae bacterium]|nr:exodeoxyribonuclease V subunit gamma [Propionibacteriaceae bacterium]
MDTVIRYRSSSLEVLAEHLAQILSPGLDDPFRQDVVLTRGGGLGRWITQYLATRLGVSTSDSQQSFSDGIVAGIEFLTLSTWENRLRHRPSPWSAQELLPHVLTCLDDLTDQPHCEAVISYLSQGDNRPRRKLDLARSVSHRLSAYATWYPEVMKSWSQGSYVDRQGCPIATTDLWQPHLWNLLCSASGSTPDDDQQFLIQQVESQGLDYGRVVLFCPEFISPTHRILLESLDRLRPVTALTLTASCSASDCLEQWTTKYSVLDSGVDTELSQITSETQVLPGSQQSPSMLHGIQNYLFHGDSTHYPCDDSLQIHTTSAHNLPQLLSTQVVNLLNSDPGLQPRDIVVLVDSLQDHVDLLNAHFTADSDPATLGRHQIRACVLGESSTDPSCDLIDVLFHILDSRATSQDLLDLLASPLVMDKFGLSTGDLDRLATLIESSGIRWGITAEHREVDQMEDFPHNTWMAGLSRMILGVALGEDELLWRGRVFPLDVVDGDSVRLVEALSLIIAHVRTCSQQWSTPTSIDGWGTRIHHTLETLTTGGPSLGHQIAYQMENHLGPPMTLAQARREFLDRCQEYRTSPSLLNGTLGIVPLSTMALVPHRVIIVYGLSADTFPHQAIPCGDDLLGPPHDSRAKDHQRFVDCLRSAQEKLIIIRSDTDSMTGHRLPQPSVEADLLGLASEIVTPGEDIATLTYHHDYSFDRVPTSVAASTLGLTARADRDDSTPPDQEETSVSIDDIANHLVNPAAAWLRRYVGITPGALSESTPSSTSLTLDLDSLETWTITDRMLRLLRTGQEPNSILETELRRGFLPPGPMGVTIARRCLTQAQTILRRGDEFTQYPPVGLNVHMECSSGKTLTGHVVVRGSAMVVLQAGKVRPHHQIAAWVKLLGLGACHRQTTWTAHLVGASHVTLQAPGADQCRAHLNYLVDLVTGSARSPLPLPPAPSALFARYSSRSTDINTPAILERMTSTWAQDSSWSLLWPTPQDMWSEPSDQHGKHDRFSSRFETLAHEVYSPVLTAGGVS